MKQTHEFQHYVLLFHIHSEPLFFRRKITNNKAHIRKSYSLSFALMRGNMPRQYRTRDSKLQCVNLQTVFDHFTRIDIHFTHYTHNFLKMENARNLFWFFDWLNCTNKHIHQMNNSNSVASRYTHEKRTYIQTQVLAEFFLDKNSN